MGRPRLAPVFARHLTVGQALQPGRRPSNSAAEPASDQRPATSAPRRLFVWDKADSGSIDAPASEFLYSNTSPGLRGSNFVAPETLLRPRSGQAFGYPAGRRVTRPGAEGFAAERHRARVAQWQRNRFVIGRLRVRIPPRAPTAVSAGRRWEIGGRGQRVGAGAAGVFDHRPPAAIVPTRRRQGG